MAGFWLGGWLGWLHKVLGFCVVLGLDQHGWVSFMRFLGFCGMGAGFCGLM